MPFYVIAFSFLKTELKCLLHCEGFSGSSEQKSQLFLYSPIPLCSSFCYFTFYRTKNNSSLYLFLSLLPACKLLACDLFIPHAQASS